MFAYWESELRSCPAELLAPAGWSLASPEPAHELEERILLALGAPAANLCHDPPLGLALLHLGVCEGVCMQQAFSRAVHVAMAASSWCGCGLLLCIEYMWDSHIFPCAALLRSVTPRKAGSTTGCTLRCSPPASFAYPTSAAMASAACSCVSKVPRCFMPR
jgi:hypothetical protein